MFRLSKSLGVIAPIAVMLISLSVSAHAGVIFATGFETSDGYTIGAIAGQNGWAVFNPGDSNDNVGTFPPPFAGAQDANVIPLASSPGQSGIYHTDTATGALIDLNAEIYIASSSTETGWQFAGLGSGLAPYIGGIDLNSSGSFGTSDQLVAITAGFPVEGAFTLNTWHDVDLLFNFTAQTYTLRLDGTVLASNLAFCTDNGPCTTPGPVAEGQFLSFFDSFGGANANDIGGLDNISLSSGVPEPATYGLTGVALLAGALLRRRRAPRA
jgi:hypothetical protein